MPPRRLKQSDVESLVSSRVAEAIAEYERNITKLKNARGTGPENAEGVKAPEILGCSYKTFLDCKPHSFNGTEGVVGLSCWFKKMESVFEISKFAEEDKVKTEIQKMEQELWTLTLKGDDIEGYNNPINMARELVEKAIQAKATWIEESNKRKWEDHQKSNNNRNINTHHQMQNRRQEVAKAYAATLAERKGYLGNRPLRNQEKKSIKDHMLKLRYKDKKGNDMILVFDYATKVSLEHHLEKLDKDRPITWAERLKICIGAAKGLKYLHFGGEDKNHNNIQRHQECYQESGILRTESDVYSFGVVMFELIPAWQKRSFGDNIAYKCIDLDLEKRPTMVRIIYRIEDAMELQVTQQADHSIGVVSPDASSPAKNMLIESVVSNTVNLDDNATRAENSDLTVLASVQFVIENTPVGSGRLVLNWPEFWRAFSLDHNRADLIWNERTRQELRGALLAEVHKLDVEKERTEDIIPGVASSKTSGQDSLPQISWNYTEFSVRYPSMSKEVCVGQYYLRLPLESGTNPRAEIFPLRDPIAYFRALYHRFLCDADTGLTVDGAVPDEMGASDNWWDMGRLDGFGGGGGFSVRKLYARAMAIV
ncbi:DnaJ homolog subfamily C GRV2 isoform X1 [Tanacetum coccineum]